jgi:hypothetical protein
MGTPSAGSTSRRPVHPSDPGNRLLSTIRRELANDDTGIRNRSFINSYDQKKGREKQSRFSQPFSNGFGGDRPVRPRVKHAGPDD